MMRIDSSTIGGFLSGTDAEFRWGAEIAGVLVGRQPGSSLFDDNDIRAAQSIADLVAITIVKVTQSKMTTEIGSPDSMYHVGDFLEQTRDYSRVKV